MVTCLNCGESFVGNFCPNCGQKAGVERLSVSVLLHEIVHVFFHLEKGFLHTAWNFLIRPGRSSINFLKGKRKQYQRPVSYILILTGLYILIHNFIISYYHLHYHFGNESISELSFKDQSNIFLRTHFTPFIFILLFASALIIYFILGRSKYNFIEVLTLCLYGGGTYFMILIFSDIILGVFFKINIISLNVFLWQTPLASFYNFWFCFDFFKKMPMRFFGLRLTIVAIFVAVAGWIIMNDLPLLWLNLNR